MRVGGVSRWGRALLALVGGNGRPSSDQGAQRPLAPRSALALFQGRSPAAGPAFFAGRSVRDVLCGTFCAGRSLRGVLCGAFSTGSCPAEAGRPSRTLRHTGGQDKHPRRPSPPGQPKGLVLSPHLPGDHRDHVRRGAGVQGPLNCQAPLSLFAVWLVPKDDAARLQRPGLQEPHSQSLRAGLEQGIAGAKDHGCEAKSVFVNQTVPHER